MNQKMDVESPSNNDWYSDEVNTPLREKRAIMATLPVIFTIINTLEG